VHAQPAELPTPSLQALKQRAHQLLDSQRSLQQQNHGLVAERLGIESERDQLVTQLQELSAERDALLAERDSLSAHLQEFTAQRDSIQQQWETLQARVEDLQGQLTAQSAQTAEQSQQREVQQKRVEDLCAEREALLAKEAILQQEQVRLSNEHQDLASERDSLQIQNDKTIAKLQDAASERDTITTQLTGLQSQLDKQMADHRNLSLALEHIFPYVKYRGARPDLGELSKREIVAYFVEKGINEEGKDLVSEESFNDHGKKLEERLELLSAANSLLVTERDEIATCLRRLQLNDETSLATDNETSEAAPTEQPREALSGLLSVHLTATTNVSDKWESYFGHYDRNLSRFQNREKAVRLLEIGVQNGGSLEAWKAFLGKDSVVIGTDVDSACSLVKSPFSVQCFTGDATDATWARQLCEAKGPFDIVIDDGSHINLDIEKTFALFFPSILPGGLYVCEDLHTAYWDKYGGCQPSKRESVMEMFKEIADLANLEHWQDDFSSSLSAQIPRLYKAKEFSPTLTMGVLMTIESIEFCNSMVFIRKCESGMSSLRQRIVSRGRASVCDQIVKADGQRSQAMGHS
jgi:uncharacterized coiled-coil DUF342 family protein